MSQVNLAAYGNLGAASNDLIFHRLGHSVGSSAETLHPLTEETCAILLVRPWWPDMGGSLASGKPIKFAEPTNAGSNACDLKKDPSLAN